MPILTGEDIYLKHGFINLCQKHAVSKTHPDISTSGGILDTHKIGEAAMEYGVPKNVVRRHLAPDTVYFDLTPQWDMSAPAIGSGV